MLSERNPEALEQPQKTTALQRANAEIKRLQEHIATQKQQLAALAPTAQAVAPGQPRMEHVYRTVNPSWTIDTAGVPYKVNWDWGGFEVDGENVPSKNHALQLVAIMRVMVVAAYVNEGWAPDWTDGSSDKFDLIGRSTGVMFTSLIGKEKEGSCAPVYFKSQDAAQRAIDILDADDPKTLRYYFGIFEGV